MKRRIRPIPDPRHIPMLDRVDMNVVDVTREIAFIANGMLPVAPLPDTAFTLGDTAVGNPFAGWEAARKRRFDQPPAVAKFASHSGMVHIVWRGLDRMTIAPLVNG